MTTHYHSQYDSDAYYNEAAYRFHHELYGLLLMHLDRQSVAPLNFAEVFEQASASLDVLMCQKSGSRVTALLNLLGQTEEVAEEVYDRIYDINEAGVDSEQCREAENILLTILQDEKKQQRKGGIYHKVQIDLTYNSNHIEAAA